MCRSCGTPTVQPAAVRFTPEVGFAVPGHRALADRFARLGSEIMASLAPDDALALITAAGVEAIDAADSASVSRLRAGALETVGATSDLAASVDEIQHKIGSGPCVDAVLEDSVFRSNDLGADTRWPEFARLAIAETSVRSMLAVRLYFEDTDLIAALNFFATRPGAFDEQDEITAVILATHAVRIISSAMHLERIANLERALESNRDIGVAIGILMARHLVTREQAFDLLRVASQNRHRKLAAVALDVIESGDLEYVQPFGPDGVPTGG